MNQRITSIFASLLVVVGSAYSAESPLRLASIFADHMVLQQGVHTPVWGYARAGIVVTIDFAGFRSQAVANDSGRWMVKLPARTHGGPFDMKVYAGDTLSIHDIMVGEVWVASGQSNMEWTVGMGVGPDTEREKSTAHHPDIRFFIVPRHTSVVPMEDMKPGVWEPVSPSTVSRLSGVAYFFARQLQQERKVAVGIISASWGATSAQAWMSAEMLQTHPDFRERIDRMDRNTAHWEETVHRQLENDRTRDSLAAASRTGFDKGVFLQGFDDRDWKSIDYPINMDKAGKPGFWGISWFRSSFEVPSTLKGKPGTLKLYLRGRETEVFVNGRSIGKTGPVEKETSFTIPAGLLEAGGNNLTVRLYQHWGIGLIGSEASKPMISFDLRSEKISLEGPWRNNNDLETSLPQMQGFYNQLTVQFNARINPVIPFGIRGVIWYQGESNAGQAHQYRTLFPMLIQDWRMRWQQGIFPFLYVQLANYRDKKATPGDDAWAELREAQALTLQQPATAMATAIDIGDPLDIHPRNKLDVGKRLYLAARKVAYGEDVVYAGPTFAGMSAESDTLQIRFTSIGTGLISRNGERLHGFSIAGSDSVFRWADAVIDGSTVKVHAAGLRRPIAVRYAWESNPDGNLYNREGLPAIPFRTDNFKLSSQ